MNSNITMTANNQQRKEILYIHVPYTPVHTNMH